MNISRLPLSERGGHDMVSEQGPPRISECNSDLNWIIDIAREVYSTLGRGLAECVYHRAFEYELRERGIRYESERVFPIVYKGHHVGSGRSDIVLENTNGEKIILEFKAITSIPRATEIEQINHYLRYLNINRGIIINFGQPSPGTQRDTVDYVIINKNGERTGNSSNTREFNVT